MVAMGLSVVRIGEFAWSRIEPEPGAFDWGWLDRAIDTLHRHGLQVVLGTPTATCRSGWSMPTRRCRCRRARPCARLRFAPALLF